MNFHGPYHGRTTLGSTVGPENAPILAEATKCRNSRSHKCKEIVMNKDTLRPRRLGDVVMPLAVLLIVTAYASAILQLA
jgi:hypothetical protein